MTIKSHIDANGKASLKEAPNKNHNISVYEKSDVRNKYEQSIVACDVLLKEEGSLDAIMKKGSTMGCAKEVTTARYLTQHTEVEKFATFKARFPNFCNRKTFNHVKNALLFRLRCEGVGESFFSNFPCSSVKVIYPNVSKLSDEDFQIGISRLKELLSVEQIIKVKTVSDACNEIFPKEVPQKKPAHIPTNDSIAAIEENLENAGPEGVADIIAKADALKAKALTLGKKKFGINFMTYETNVQPSCLETSSKILNEKSLAFNTKSINCLHIGFASTVNPIADPMPPADTDGYIHTDDDAFNVISYPLRGDALLCEYFGSLDDSETKDTSDPQMEFGFDVKEEATTVNNEQFSDKPIVDAVLSYIDIYVGSDATKVYSLTADGVCFIKEQPTLNLSEGDTATLIEFSKRDIDENYISKSELAHWKNVLLESANHLTYGEAS